MDSTTQRPRETTEPLGSGSTCEHPDAPELLHERDQLVALVEQSHRLHHGLERWHVEIIRPCDLQDLDVLVDRARQSIALPRPVAHPKGDR
jgi:hypothetical protein